MNKKHVLYILIFFLIPFFSFSQNDTENEKQKGHININKFRQLYEEFSSPNMFRTASGAPGPAYYQQQADYIMQIELDDQNKRIYGNQTITYTNNSPDELLSLIHI